MQTSLTLNMDLNSIPPKSYERHNFVQKFTKDVAYLVNLSDTSRLVIDSMRSGSLIVDFSIKPHSDGQSFPGKNVFTAFNTSGVVVAGVKTTTAVKSSDIQLKVNCKGSWGEWGECSKECGGGTSARSYKVSVAASGGGKSCGDTRAQTKGCNADACVVKCKSSKVQRCKRLCQGVPTQCEKGQCLMNSDGCCDISCKKP